MSIKSSIKLGLAALTLLAGLVSCSKEPEAQKLVMSLAKAENVTTDYAKITWTAVGGATGYDYVVTVGESSFTQGHTMDTYVELKSLSEATAYTVKVKALGDGKTTLESDYSICVFTTDPEDRELNAKVTSASFDGVGLQLTWGADISSIKYLVGGRLSEETDAKAFEDGKVDDTIKTDGYDGKLTVTPAAGAPSVIFFKGVSKSGKETETVKIYATAAPVSFTPSLVSLGSFVATVDEYSGSDYVGIGILAMAAETPEEWGMSAEEIISMYAMFGMLDILAPGDSKLVELNGMAEKEHIIGIAYFDQDYWPSEIKLFNYTSGKVQPDAPKASVDAKVTDITANSATINITPNDATCGYFYKLYTKADFDADIQQGKDLKYSDPMDYIREIVSVGGTMGYKATVDTRDPLSANTDFVLVCFPYNMNGSEGWGDTAKVEFKTLEQTSNQTAVAPATASSPKKTVNGKELNSKNLLKK